MIPHRHAAGVPFVGRLVVLAALAAVVAGAERIEARGFVGCSPGRVCMKQILKCLVPPCPATDSVITSDALELHPLTNRPLAFFPNYTGPQAPPVQVLNWSTMLAFDPDLGARIRLNPAIQSTTTMQSLQAGGVPFFPALHSVDLFLLFEFETGDALFNADPIRLVSDGPVTGFPPAFGPNYVSTGPVDLFDVGDPMGPPVFTLQSSSVSGDVEDLFDLAIVPIGPDQFRVSVALESCGPEIPAKLFVAATPGWSIPGPNEIDVLVDCVPSFFDITATAPPAPCFDYIEVWIASLDPGRPAMSTRMIELPDDPNCFPPDPIADAGPYQTAASGDLVFLKGSGQSDNGTVNYSWVAPHGVALGNPTSPAPSFVAPPTSIHRELVFTLFVDDGVTVSPPDTTVVRVLAAPGGRAHGLALAKNVPPGISLRWDPSCSSADVDYEIYEGEMGVWYSHEALPGACTTGGLTTATITPGPGNRYYLVVPTDAVIEGSYGVDGSGAERPPPKVAACRPQSLGPCP